MAQPSEPSGVVDTRVVLVADRVVDGTGRPALEDAAVVIDGEQIVAVGPAAKITERVPATVPRLTYPGCTILPGLIDSHVHLTFSAGRMILRDLQADSDARLVMRAAVNAREALLAGVTTVRDLGGRGRLTLEIRDAIAEGLMLGPRVLATGRPITIPDGHLHFLGGTATGVAGVTALAEELVEQGVDAIKVMATGGNATPTSDPLQPAYSLEELRAIVAVADAAGIRVTAHARGRDGIAVVAESGIQGIEHCRMEVGPGQWGFDEALARRIAEQGIFAAPTLAASYRAFQHRAAGGQVGIRAGAVPMEQRLENARRLRECGVRVVVGTDAGATLARFDEAVHLECELLVEAGWSPLAAIEAGTLGAATAIGRAHDRGSIEAGKLADLLVVQGDPTRRISDLRAVECVFLGGRRVVEQGQLTVDARPRPWPWTYETSRYQVDTGQPDSRP